MRNLDDGCVVLSAWKSFERRSRQRVQVDYVPFAILIADSSMCAGLGSEAWWYLIANDGAGGLITISSSRACFPTLLSIFKFVLKMYVLGHDTSTSASFPRVLDSQAPTDAPTRHKDSQSNLEVTKNPQVPVKKMQLLNCSSYLCVVLGHL